MKIRNKGFHPWSGRVPLLAAALLAGACGGGPGPEAVTILDSLDVSGTKNFRIDHPLAPERRYLLHFATEGPEPWNLYSGRVRLDGAGSAEIRLPEWFEAINRDFRYQLTPLGDAAPALHVAAEIHNNRFRIAGGPAGLEVSWQVLARRDDRTIQRLDPVPELDKPAHLHGSYVDPLAWENREGAD